MVTDVRLGENFHFINYDTFWPDVKTRGTYCGSKAKFVSVENPEVWAIQMKTIGQYLTLVPFIYAIFTISIEDNVIFIIRTSFGEPKG